MNFNIKSGSYPCPKNLKFVRPHIQDGAGYYTHISKDNLRVARILSQESENKYLFSLKKRGDTTETTQYFYKVGQDVFVDNEQGGVLLSNDILLPVYTYRLTLNEIMPMAKQGFYISRLVWVTQQLWYDHRCKKLIRNDGREYIATTNDLQANDWCLADSEFGISRREEDCIKLKSLIDPINNFKSKNKLIDWGDGIPVNTPCPMCNKHVCHCDDERNLIDWGWTKKLSLIYGIMPEVDIIANNWQRLAIFLKQDPDLTLSVPEKQEWTPYVRGIESISNRPLDVKACLPCDRLYIPMPEFSPYYDYITLQYIKANKHNDGDVFILNNINKSGTRVGILNKDIQVSKWAYSESIENVDITANMFFNYMSRLGLDLPEYLKTAFLDDDVNEETFVSWLLQEILGVDGALNYQLMSQYLGEEKVTQYVIDIIVKYINTSFVHIPWDYIAIYLRTFLEKHEILLKDWVYTYLPYMADKNTLRLIFKDLRDQFNSGGLIDKFVIETPCENYDDVLWEKLKRLCKIPAEYSARMGGISEGSLAIFQRLVPKTMAAIYGRIKTVDDTAFKSMDAARLALEQYVITQYPDINDRILYIPAPVDWLEIKLDLYQEKLWCVLVGNCNNDLIRDQLVKNPFVRIFWTCIFLGDERAYEGLIKSEIADDIMSDAIAQIDRI